MKEIVLSLLVTEQGLSYYTPVIQKFEALHPGCHVRVEAMTWEEAWGKLFNFTIRGEGPSVSEIGSNWSNPLVGMQALRPFRMSEIDAIGGEDAFFPVAWKSVHQINDSTIWSIPFKINTYIVAYNRDLLAKASIDEKTAFLSPQSFAEAIQELSASGVQTPFLIARDYYPVSLLHTIASWIWALGGDFISADEHRVLFNQPEARSGIAAWFELYSQIAPEYRSLTEEDVMKKFLAGESAIWIGDFGNGSDIAMNRSQFGMAAMPGIPFIGGSNLAVWQHSRYGNGGETLAVELASYLASFAGQRVIHDELKLQSLPARKDILPFIDCPNETIKMTSERTAQSGRPHNEIQLWTRIETQLGKTLADISRTVLAHPEKNLDKILDDYLLPLEQRFNLLLNP